MFIAFKATVIVFVLLIAALFLAWGVMCVVMAMGTSRAHLRRRYSVGRDVK